MKLFIILLLQHLLFSYGSLQVRVSNSCIENALIIAKKNSEKLDPINQLLIVSNNNYISHSAILVALERSGKEWIDDPESDDYNKHIRGDTKAKSYENLMLSNNAYKYCIVIKYNTCPVIKGRGSAIFFHLGEDPPGSTAGCVAIRESDMKLIIGWLHPKHKPSILMGNNDLLKSGL